MSSGIIEMLENKSGLVTAIEIIGGDKIKVEIDIKYKTLHYFQQEDNETWEMLRAYIIERIKNLGKYEKKKKEITKRAEKIKEMMLEIDFTDSERAAANELGELSEKKLEESFEKRETMLQIAKLMLDMKIKNELEGVACECCKKEL